MPRSALPIQAPDHRVRLQYVGAAVGALVLLALLLTWQIPMRAPSEQPGSPISVYGTALKSANDVCDLNGVGYSGFNTQPGILLYKSIYVQDQAKQACRVSTIQSLTPGFSVTSASLPLSINAGQIGVMTIAIKITTPTYQGILTLAVG